MITSLYFTARSEPQYLLACFALSLYSPMKQLKWIDAVGDLFLLIGEKHRDKWSGIAKRELWQNGVAEIAADFTDPLQADYGLACGVSGLFGVVEVAQGHALVLAGLRVSLAHFSRGEDEFFIVRWMYAPDKDHVAYLLSAFNPDAYTGWKRETDFAIDSNTSFIFDPGLTWQKREEINEDFLAFDTRPGKYTIHTLAYEPDEETSLYVHRFSHTADFQQQ